MSRHHQPRPAHDLRRGDTVEARDIPSPIMQITRLSDYDNGTVECLWFTRDQLVQRAWLPAESLRRVPAPRFRERVDVGRYIHPGAEAALGRANVMAGQPWWKR